MNDEAVIPFATAGVKTMADDTLRLTIDIEPRYADAAFRLFGKRGIPGALARLTEEAAQARADEDEGRSPKGAHGQFWRALIASGFFRAPPVLRAIGPESAFEEWIRSQQAVIGPDDYDEGTGEIRNQCAHVRRVAEGSGTAEKPPYFAVPLSAAVHREQHQNGEAAVMHNWPISRSLEFPSAEQAKEWFERKADQYRTEWASNRLAKQLRPTCRSRSEVPPDDVLLWAERANLERFLPKSVRDGTHGLEEDAA